MHSSSQFLLTIGGILLLGLLISTVAGRTFLPRVTLLLLFGLLIGAEGLDVIPKLFTDRFDIIADMTLLMVGFLLGGKLTVKSMHETAGEVLWISITAAVVTTVLVSLALLWIGMSFEIAIILGCIASATAPAAILDVVEEIKDTGRFSRLLLSIVAFDDIWALMLFGIGMALVKTLNGIAGEASFLLIAVWEIGGAIVLGIVIGLPAAYLTGRVRKGEPVLTEALGIVFVCGGLAIWLEVSYLIAAMVMGAIITNLARHHSYPFHAIEGIERPFMVIFFVLAGASLEVSALQDIGLLVLVYIVSRSAGKLLGAWLGCRGCKADMATSQWMGLALLPQAGVAVGMALVAANQFPQYHQVLLSIVISATIIFEIIGPVFTRLAIQRGRLNKS